MGQPGAAEPSSAVSGHGMSYRVKYLQLLVRQRSDDALSAVDLSLAQYVVLRELAAEPGLRSAELARRCFITRQAIRDVLASLMERGLVLDAGTASGRLGALTLSDDGVEAGGHGATVMRGLDESMLGGLDLHERHDLARLLDRCIANLGRS